MIGILADDADPMVNVMKVEKAPLESYADIGGLDTQIQEIKEAKRQAKQAAQEGKWVLAEECQVQASIRQKIEQVFQSLKTTEINKDFRLWLVTESTSFSAEFLKQCSNQKVIDVRLDLV